MSKRKKSSYSYRGKSYLGDSDDDKDSDSDSDNKKEPETKRRIVKNYDESKQPPIQEILDNKKEPESKRDIVENYDDEIYDERKQPPIQEILDKYVDMLLDVDELQTTSEGEKIISEFIKDNQSEIKKDLYYANNQIMTSSYKQLEILDKLERLYLKYKSNNEQTMQEILDKYSDMLLGVDELLTTPEGKKIISEFIKDNQSEIKQDLYYANKQISSSPFEQTSLLSKLEMLYLKYKPQPIVFGINKARINLKGFGGKLRKKTKKRKIKKRKTKKKH
jgi:hypothetical protein